MRFTFCNYQGLCLQFICCFHPHSTLTTYNCSNSFLFIFLEKKLKDKWLTCSVKGQFTKRLKRGNTLMILRRNISRKKGKYSVVLVLERSLFCVSSLFTSLFLSSYYGKFRSLNIFNVICCFLTDWELELLFNGCFFIDQ